MKSNKFMKVCIFVVALLFLGSLASFILLIWKG
jgi:hypothetical protein